MIKPLLLCQIYISLLLEHKIVLLKHDCCRIAVLFQALFQLIRPFQWCCSVVSSLNENMLDILDAPFPYIVGLEKHHIV